MIYDVAIIGCGPAGIFTALELLKNNPNTKIIMFEKGRNIKIRKCPKAITQKCVHCNPCNISSGWGGAGAFSDGKLSLSKDVGGWLEEYIGAEKLTEYIKYVDNWYLEYGGTKEVSYNEQFANSFGNLCEQNNLKLIKCPVRHLGTERNLKIMTQMYEYISSHENVTFISECNVDDIIPNDIKEIIISKKDIKETFKANNVVIAVGRAGAEWLNNWCEKNDIEVSNNQVDVGVRVELPREITDSITNELYEFKIYNKSKSTQNSVRTFCMNPGGFVSQENYDENNIAVVNGHSYHDKKSNLTNFSLLVSSKFTEPFEEPIKYGKYIATLANMLTGGSIMVQRLKDLKNNKRSTYESMKELSYEPTLKDAVPGDLSFVFPGRILNALLETFEALDKVCPGINGDETIMYGVEVKFYSSKVEVNNNLETKYKGIYAIGDGAGITRGLIQASISGVIAAKDIISK